MGVVIPQARRLACSVVFGLLWAGAPSAAEGVPRDVAEYVARREVCEHFRQEPWPEGSSAEDKDRREFIARQLAGACSGADRALRELKEKYGKDRAVMDRLNAYEPDIEGRK